MHNFFIEKILKVNLFLRNKHQNVKAAISICLIYSLLLFIPGCDLHSSKEVYENFDFGIKLQKPVNWRINYHQRSGTILLLNNNYPEILTKVEIIGEACIPWINEPEEEILLDIKRIKLLYALEAVKIIQMPATNFKGNYKIVSAIIEIPAIMLEDNNNHEEKHNLEEKQRIVIYEVMEEDHGVKVFLYNDVDDALNIQAQEIVDSLTFVCTSNLNSH